MCYADGKKLVSWGLGFFSDSGGEEEKGELGNRGVNSPLVLFLGKGGGRVGRREVR